MKMSRYRLACNSGIPQSSITNLLNRRSIPTTTTLAKICKGLGLTLAQFFTYEDNHPNLTKEQAIFLDQWDSLTEIDKLKVLAYIQGIIDSRE